MTQEIKVVDVSFERLQKKGFDLRSLKRDVDRIVVIDIPGFADTIFDIADRTDSHLTLKTHPAYYPVRSCEISIKYPTQDEIKNLAKLFTRYPGKHDSWNALTNLFR